MIAKSTDLARYFELKKSVESIVFVQRKKDMESLHYKGSPEHIKNVEYIRLSNSRQLKRYYATLSTNEYRLFLESDAALKGKQIDDAMKKDPKIKAYLKFRNSKNPFGLKI